MANEETLLRTQMFPRFPAHATFVADANFAPETQKMFLNSFIKNVSEFFSERMFASATNVSPFARRNICVRNNVSSFATALIFFYFYLLLFILLFDYSSLIWYYVPTFLALLIFIEILPASTSLRIS